MTTDPDPFEQGQRAARENIPAEGNPYQDGSGATCALGRPVTSKSPARSRLTSSKTNKRGTNKLGKLSALQPIFFRPFLKRGPLMA